MHVTHDPNAQCAEIIQFSDFLKVDIRIGEIVRVEEFPEARNPSYKLYIDFGICIGEKKSAAQVTDLYTKEVLLGRKIAAVVNFKPRQIGPFMSEVLVLGFTNEFGQVVLFSPDQEVPKGSRLH